MLKIILSNSVVMLMIVCGGFQSINGEALQCKFGDISYNYHLFRTTFYTCSVTELENSNDTKIITGYNGVHQSNEIDRNVKQIYISELDTKYIPEGLGSLFNLYALHIRKSKLVEIRSKDFHGMQNLKYLSLSDNKLTSVPSDAFSTLTKLDLIFLNDNQIKFIGSGAFEKLTCLHEVFLHGNICVSNLYLGSSEITQMKEDIKVNCDPLKIIINLEQQNKELIKQNVALEKEEDVLKLETDALQKQLEQLEKKILRKEHEALIELFNKTAEINELKDSIQKMSLELDKQHTESEMKTQELMTKISHLIQPTAEQLICDFNDEAYNILGLLYSCDVTSLDNKCNNKVINGQSGVHKDHRNASNVKAIYIFNTKTTHIPKGLGSLFNLTAFQMFNTQLKEIRIKDFKNMDNLEYLNFDYNKLTTVPLDVLKMFTKLKYISLQANEISELIPGLFDNNLQLVEVYIDRNRIQIIGSGLFNGLTKLTRVFLNGNKCVDKDYEGSTDMVQLREDVELNCKEQH